MTSIAPKSYHMLKNKYSQKMHICSHNQTGFKESLNVCKISVWIYGREEKKSQ